MVVLPLVMEELTAGLGAYIHKVERRTRDLIQLNVAADLEWCRDIKKFSQLEIQARQMVYVNESLARTLSKLYDCEKVTTNATQISDSRRRQLITNVLRRALRKA